jgi:hypothetical protein
MFSSNVRLEGRLLLVAVALSATACGGSAPTSPSPTSTPQYSTPPATVSSVLPASLPPSDSSQTIIVVGSNFKPGLTVDLTASTGATATIGGSAIQSLTDTSFEASVTVAAPGTYTLRVTNPASPPSPAVTVTAQGADTPRPTIAGLSPSSPPQSTASQMVVVAGSNFQAGLTAVLTGPTGTTTTLGGSAIDSVTQTLFHLTATLADAGSYKLRVSNPSGQMSEPWTFTVRTPDPPAKPTVTGLSPSTPTKNSAVQMVYIAGTSFESGATVALTLPNGTTSTLSGSEAIPYVSATTVKIMVTLADAGSYSLRVTNPSGLVSEAYAFTVKAPDAPAKPAVTGLSPATPTTSSAAQMVYVNGTGFEIGRAHV